jgi:hypothetical protein
VGQQILPDQCIPITDEKAKSISLKHITIKYDATIDQSVNTVSAKGQILFNENEFRGASDFSSIFITAYLIDIDYVVLRELKFQHVEGLGGSFAPIPFEVTFPYEQNYRCIAFSYRIQYYQ